MRKSVALLLLGPAALLGACGDSGTTTEPLTGIRLSVRFDPKTMEMDQVRVAGQFADTNEEAFSPGLAPATAGGPFSESPQTVVLLLPDDYGGRQLRLHVYGIRQGEEVAYGQVTVDVVRGAVVPAVVDLEDKVPTCGDGEVTLGLERCDTGLSPSDPSRCPEGREDCDDSQSCTQDVFHDDGPCRTWCEHRPITECRHGDGCCPEGCGPDTDSDCEAVCGDGIVSPGELCDKGIEPGQPGSCPTEQDCRDANPCTVDTLVDGTSCQARCEHDLITDPIGGDGCCPAGENANTDTDCPVVCGNGVLELGEECDLGIQAGDPGSCPTDCEDADPCTLDSLYDPGTCRARCVHTIIDRPADGDGCCPAGADATIDSDCEPICGNGVVEPGERCDTGITWPDFGSCPTQPSDCDDGLACTQDTLEGATCLAECVHTDVTSCQDNDGCCPAGCTDSNDADCNLCGNGILDAGESCDTAIASGNRGACPTSCDDGDPCTVDTLLAPGTCDATCVYEPPPCDLNNGDGCCPPGCNANTDQDCESVCGNAVLEPGELCDTGIPSGDAGACPTSCNDGDACTQDTLQGQDCQTECLFEPITSCTPGDGCCPAGCGLVQDNGDTDCPGCGNGITEGSLGEECDDGNRENNDSCTTSCTNNYGNVGDPCTDTAPCSAGNFCLAQPPGGYCTRTCQSDQQCPTGSVCSDQLGNEGPTNYCVETCTTDTECRWDEGYKCTNISGGRKACLPD